MFLQYFQLTGKVVREPVKEIRLKKITVVVIPATFLAANSSAGLASTPATVTAGIYCFVASGAAPARVLRAGRWRGAEGAEQEKSCLGMNQRDFVTLFCAVPH